jgi:hypothetical protein
MKFNLKVYKEFVCYMRQMLLIGIILEFLCWTIHEAGPWVWQAELVIGFLCWLATFLIGTSVGCLICLAIERYILAPRDPDNRDSSSP